MFLISSKIFTSDQIVFSESEPNMTEESSVPNDKISKILEEFNLTKEMINEFEAEFKAYDKRNTGKISSEDLGQTWV